ncbi:hypothetical protein FRX31_012230 [Thalictrum thalictroides]|uniref:DUF4283 domain-containing protein n=1 Tax=Thalictrum thalictroides TaxID=46969 RepID=A0A7J6WMI7_THATH|nr:hypothetical protein FRX31_012230 [Thalictrum thalictroides]
MEREPWTILGYIVVILPYTANMEPADVVLNSIPLWLSLKGLLLQHMHTNTVAMIAAATGEVEIVLPQLIVPRTAEGFRAKVRVLRNQPLLHGCDVNTVEGRKDGPFLFMEQGDPSGGPPNPYDRKGKSLMTDNGQTKDSNMAFNKLWDSWVAVNQAQKPITIQEVSNHQNPNCFFTSPPPPPPTQPHPHSL